MAPSGITAVRFRNPSLPASRLRSARPEWGQSSISWPLTPFKLSVSLIRWDGQTWTGTALALIPTFKLSGRREHQYGGHVPAPVAERSWMAIRAAVFGDHGSRHPSRRGLAQPRCHRCGDNFGRSDTG